LLSLPPNNPYVKTRNVIFFEKDAAKNAIIAQMLPTIVAIRNPNLLVNPLAIGPTIIDMCY
jgi:hypothetical protein